MIVAAITYPDLMPSQKAEAMVILRLHPSFKKWLAEPLEQATNLDEGVICYMGANKWPDEINEDLYMRAVRAPVFEFIFG